MIKRYESGKYAIDDSVTKEYLKVCTILCFLMDSAFLMMIIIV